MQIFNFFTLNLSLNFLFVLLYMIIQCSSLIPAFTDLLILGICYITNNILKSNDHNFLFFFLKTQFLYLP